MKTSTRTQFAIRRTEDGWYWCGDKSWSSDPVYARRFDAMLEADLVGIAEVPEADGAWGVEPIGVAA